MFFNTGSTNALRQVVSLPILLPILLAPDVRKQYFVDLDPLALVSRARGLVLGTYGRAAHLGRSGELIGGGLRRGRNGRDDRSKKRVVVGGRQVSSPVGNFM